MEIKCQAAGPDRARSSCLDDPSSAQEPRETLGEALQGRKDARTAVFRLGLLAYFGGRANVPSPEECDCISLAARSFFTNTSPGNFLSMLALKSLNVLFLQVSLGGFEFDDD